MTSGGPENGARGVPEILLRRCWEAPGKSDHRIPSEAARLIADEREVAPSFM
jgi:hypothetical protein